MYIFLHKLFVKKFQRPRFFQICRDTRQCRIQYYSFRKDNNKTLSEMWNDFKLKSKWHQQKIKEDLSLHSYLYNIYN